MGETVTYMTHLRPFLYDRKLYSLIESINEGVFIYIRYIAQYIQVEFPADDRDGDMNLVSLFDS